MNVFTHRIKKSGQLCFMVPIFPWLGFKDAHHRARENAYPMVHIEGGQVTRVNRESLERI